MCNLIRTQLTQLTQISANENVWQLNTDDPLNPNYAIHCSAFTINNGCANVRQWLRQAYSPPNGDIAFSPTLRFRSSPFEGGGGGMFLCVRSFVIQSEAMNLLLFPARFLTTFGMTKGDLNQYSFRLTALKKNKTGESIPHPCGMGLK